MCGDLHTHSRSTSSRSGMSAGRRGGCILPDAPRRPVLFTRIRKGF
jgi:hypothetical protein